MRERFQFYFGSFLGRVDYCKYSNNKVSIVKDIETQRYKLQEEELYLVKIFKLLVIFVIFEDL